jgi:hypothetical protein
MAITAEGVDIKIEHVGRLVLHPCAPVQPANAMVLAATSVKVTVEPTAKNAEHAVCVLPQLIPVTGLLLVMTLGLTGPRVLTDRV